MIQRRLQFTLKKEIDLNCVPKWLEMGIKGSFERSVKMNFKTDA